MYSKQRFILFDDKKMNKLQVFSPSSKQIDRFVDLCFYTRFALLVLITLRIEQRITVKRDVLDF